MFRYKKNNYYRSDIIVKKNIYFYETKSLSKIHLENLKYDVLPNFGEAVLKKYFEKILKKKNSLIVFKKNKNILGFLVLNFYNIKLYNILDLKSILKFILNLFYKPSIFFNLLFQIFRKKLKPKLCSEIHALAVKKNFTSKGIGNLLIKKAEIITRKKGFKGIIIKTHNRKLFEHFKKTRKIKLLKTYKILNRTYYTLYWPV